MTPSDTRRSRRPCDDVEAATLAATGLPRCPDHLPDVLCPLPRRIETGACIGCFPARAAFPVTLAGRHPRLHFRGLLRLHSRYGPSGRSTAQGGLCHEASARLLHPTARQLPELPITLWVAPSSTGHPRLFEAHSVSPGWAERVCEIGSASVAKQAARCPHASFFHATWNFTGRRLLLPHIAEDAVALPDARPSHALAYRRRP